MLQRLQRKHTIWHAGLSVVLVSSSQASMAGGSTEELQKRALCVQRDKKHFERLHQQSKGDLEREQRAADFAKWEEVMKRRETNTSKQEKQRLDRYVCCGGPMAEIVCTDQVVPN